MNISPEKKEKKRKKDRLDKHRRSIDEANRTNRKKKKKRKKIRNPLLRCVVKERVAARSTGDRGEGADCSLSPRSRDTRAYRGKEIRKSWRVARPAEERGARSEYKVSKGVAGEGRRIDTGAS